MALKAGKDLRGVKEGNRRLEGSQNAHCAHTQGWTRLYISKTRISIRLFCLFISWGWGWGVEPSRTKRHCYQSCKMVYYPVSNCTWKGTSNLYEKCLRLPAHPVIHARSVPVMPENKRRCTSPGKETPHVPYQLVKGCTKMLFSQMNWSLSFKIMRGCGTGEERKNFSFDLTGLWSISFKGEMFCCDSQPYALGKVKSWNKGAFFNNGMEKDELNSSESVLGPFLNLEMNCFKDYKYK